MGAWDGAIEENELVARSEDQLKKLPGEHRLGPSEQYLKVTGKGEEANQMPIN